MAGQDLFPATRTALGGLGRAAARTVALGIMVAGAVATGAGFLIAALYMWLAQLLTPPAAAALTGLALLFGASLLALGFLAWRRERLARPDPASAIAHDLVAAIKARPIDAVLLALTTGISAGAPRR